MDRDLGIDISGTISRVDFRAWAEQQPRGRYERVDGRVVKMTPEQIVHVELKSAILQALTHAIRKAGQIAGRMVTALPSKSMKIQTTTRMPWSIPVPIRVRTMSLRRTRS